MKLFARENRTAANAVSWVRLFAAPFVAYLLFQQVWTWGAICFATVALTDKLDGWLARRFDQHTKLGKALDPTIDIVLMGLSGTVLLFSAPTWLKLLMAILLVREFIAAIGALRRRVAGLPDLPVSDIGKWARFAVGGATVGFLLYLGTGQHGWLYAGAVFYAIGIPLGVWSCWCYWRPQRIAPAPSS